MRAVLIERFGQEPSVHDVPEPVAPPGGALVRVEASGLCRSDWHALMGHDSDVTLPHVPGHEFAGTVSSVGDGVDRSWLGRRVTAPFVYACGQCELCRAGEQQVCLRQEQPGFSRWGSFAEHVVVDQAAVNLVELPDQVDAVSAAVLGCRFATAFRAVTVVGGVRPGEWVAVHGCGGVGLSAVMIAVAAGARVAAVDISPAALALASEFGAELTIDAAQVQDRATVHDHGAGVGHGDGVGAGVRGGAGVGEAVRELTGGGAHLSLDALGSAATCAASIAGLRARGRHVQVGLLPAALGLPPVPMHLVVAGELQVLGSHGMPAHAYPGLLALVGSGRLRPDALVTSRISLDDAGPALARMDQAHPAGIAVISAW